jgi:hypothetical protein
MRPPGAARHLDRRAIAIVGQQVTLRSRNAGVAGPRIDLILARASAAIPECEVVVKDIVDGTARGWLRRPDGAFDADRGGEPAVTDAALRALARTPGRGRTYTCVPPGSARRLGLDRDQDGCPEGGDPVPENPGIGCGG